MLVGEINITITPEVMNGFLTVTLPLLVGMILKHFMDKANLKKQTDVVNAATADAAAKATKEIKEDAAKTAESVKSIKEKVDDTLVGELQKVNDRLETIKSNRPH